MRSLRLSICVFVVDDDGGCCGCPLGVWLGEAGGLPVSGRVSEGADGDAGGGDCCALTSIASPPTKSRLKHAPMTQYMRFIGAVLLFFVRHRTPATPFGR
jgi:hypothetical protein